MNPKTVLREFWDEEYSKMRLESNGHEFYGLSPCPFCGAGEFRIDETKHWTGMSYTILSVKIMHWCTRLDGQPQSTVQIKGKTFDDAKRLWEMSAN